MTTLGAPPQAVCVVPARGGSKRLAHKNVLPVGGRPMLLHTIDAALESGLFSRVFVSTEDAEIGDVAQAAGAVIHVRANALAGDAVSATDVCIDLYEARCRLGERYDAIVCLQPSSPLRTASDIVGAWGAYLETDADFVVSATRVDPHFFHWALQQDGEWWRMAFGDRYLMERALLPPVHRPNGAIKIGRVPALLQYRHFFGPRLAIFEMPEERSLHVATSFDLSLVEGLVRRRAPQVGAGSDRVRPLIAKFKRGLEVSERLHRLVPGGSHTYSKGEDQFPHRSPRIMARAEGAYCYDIDGNRYLDWAMGNRVIILGHAYPVVNEAVKRQIDEGVNFSRPAMLECELAEYLVDLWPVAEMVKFGKNGSDVTTAAVKLARAATGRKYVACCAEHPFFSIHDWFIGSTSMNAGVPEEVSALTVRFRYNDIESVEELFAQYPGQIAAVILEPVKNEEPRDGFLEKLRAVTRRDGAVLVFDEMISGIRFDLLGAHHRWGVYPDLATFGKAIGNGYSISVLAGKRELMELGGLRHEKARVFLLSQTHGSESVGLAACRATLRECERLDVSEHVWMTGRRLVQGVRQVAAEAGVSDYVRMVGFDCNPQLIATRADGAYWPELHTLLHEELIAHGVLIPWTSVSYVHGSAEIQMTLDALEQAARRVRIALDSDSVETSFEGPAVQPVFRRYN